MYPQGTPAGADPFGLFSAPGDPFAPAPAEPVGAPPAVAAAPELNADGSPKIQPGFVSIDDYKIQQAQLKELEPLKNLAWIGQAMADPETAARVRSALFAGAGAPTNVTPAPDPAAAKARLEASWKSRIDAQLATGDVSGAMMLSAQMGAELATATNRAEFETASAPFVALTAQNAIATWKNAKRASSPLFSKLEAKFDAFVAQTPQATLAQLTASGQLNNALSTAYNQIVGSMYEQGYDAAAASGRLGQPVQPVPPYGAGTSGGPTIGPSDGVPTDEDKDDAEFVRAAAARGITIKLGAHGEYTSESKT